MYIYTGTTPPETRAKNQVGRIMAVSHQGAPRPASTTYKEGLVSREAGMPGATEENRIQKIGDPSNTLTFAYDDQGQRMLKRGPPP